MLVHTISHDYNLLTICGHYLSFDGDTATFCRYPIQVFNLTQHVGREGLTAYEFTRKLYDESAPGILKIIKDATLLLPEPPVETSLSVTGAETSETPLQ